MALGREALEEAIAELTVLMGLEEAAEAQFQTWFESHPVVFEVLGYTRVVPHPEFLLDGEGPMYPDFIAQRPDGLWDVVELKRPDTQVLRNPERRSVFYSGMGTYVAQCQEYSERAGQEPVRRYLRETGGIEMNALPPCMLIAGRSAGLDRLKVHDLLKRSTIRISHQTYDDIHDALQRHFVGNFLGSIGGPGLSLYAEMLLTASESSMQQCLLDLGSSPDRNRITVLRDVNARLKLVVKDDAGLASSQEVDVARYSNGVGFICGVHVTHALDAFLVLLEINGQYAVEHRVAYGNMTIEDVMPLAVGADMHGEQGASMGLGFLMCRHRELNPLERTQLRGWLFDRFRYLLQESPDQSQFRGVRYSGNQFMYSEGHPILDAGHPASTNLVQRNDARRPTYAAPTAPTNSEAC